MYKLGLIGQSISKSKAPSLHKFLGELCGVSVNYELHVPADTSEAAFKETLAEIRALGYNGCNVTFPYKQIAVGSSETQNDGVRLVGSTNTLEFKNQAPSAFNTDYTGFILGYKGRLGDLPAGKVLLLGAGGVGRAVAFGVFEVGATEVLVFDPSADSANALAASLNESGFKATVVDKAGLPEAAAAADGIVNCSPIGHYQTPGIPIDPALIAGQKWAFDAVYIPMDTEFLIRANQQGLKIVSGFDLFFYQGVDAFEIFTGIKVDAVEALAKYKETFGIQSDLID